MGGPGIEASVSACGWEALVGGEGLQWSMEKSGGREA